MKRITIGFLSLVAILLSFTFCSDDSNKAVVYNDYVVGYTSGMISSTSPVCVILSEDLTEEKMKSVDLSKVMKITPTVEGTYSFQDSHTLLFKPKSRMSYGEIYNVSVDLEELFESADEFEFKFQTNSFGLNASYEGLDVDDEKGMYVFKFKIRTTGEEPCEKINELLKVECLDSYHSKLTENSSTDFTYKVFVKRKEAGTLSVLSVENEELGLKEEVLSKVTVPSASAFSFYDITYHCGTERYVLVTFNKNLDQKQNLLGLAYIEDNKSQTVEIEGNKLKLYPDNNREGEVAVFLSNKIRSKYGETLHEDVTKILELDIEKPDFMFIGDGVIIPQTDQVTIPFRSIYLKGVRVYVYKIFANNIASLLQDGTLREYDGLIRWGRPVAVTTFFMDESSDFSEWRNYSIDLSPLVKMEPGCMYRVELEVDHRLSAWPCDEAQSVDRSVFEKEDQLKMAELCEQFDSPNSYYYASRDWSGFNWKERNDPCKKSYYLNLERKGKNVLATNIGLVAYSPSNSHYTVMALDLQSAEGVSDATIEIYNRQKQMIAQGSTDGEGRFDYVVDPKLGAPFFVMAKKGSDVSGLRVVRGEELSTSTFDIAGDMLQKGLKGYIYGERGVWRPGDTIHLSFMLKDKEKTLPEKHPVSLELINPQGQTYRSMTKRVGALGLYSFSVPTEESVPTGSWLANVHVGGATFSKRLRVETIKPNRLKIDLRLPEELKSGAERCKLHTEWLNGSATHDLKYEVDVKLSQGVTTFPKWEDYCFDDRTKMFESKDEQMAKGVTDGSGDAEVLFNIASQKNASGKLLCNVTTRVYESSGEFSTDVQQVRYSPYKIYVGIKSPQKSDDGCLETGKKHKFSLVALSETGVPKPFTNVSIHVYKVDWYWWWSCSSYDLANYYSSSYKKVVGQYTKTTDAFGTSDFELMFDQEEWGTYLIVAECGGHSSSILAYFDWTSHRDREGGANSTALTISTDKKEYKPGETIAVTLPTTHEGQAIVSVCNSGRILEMKTIKCSEGNSVVKFVATEDMMPTAYVTATLVQPYNHTAHNDMPIRMYGVSPISVVSDDTRLNPQITCPVEVRPLSSFDLKVEEKDGKQMAYSLAIVDEGLLDLTRFKTPNAWPTFYAREAYGMRIWDLYSDVCGAFGGKIDQMFSVGGDESLLNNPKAVVNRFAPMVYFDGPFVVQKGKSNSHKINVPNYNGRVRVMVVAGDGTAYGCAEKSVKVAQSLMVIGTMPRQVGVGDEVTVSATMFVSDDNLNSVKTTLTCSEGLSVVGENGKVTEFSEKGDKTVQFRVKAGEKEGVGKIAIQSTSGSEKATYVIEVPIRRVSQRLFKSVDFAIEPKSEVTKKISAPGSEQLSTSLEISQLKPLNASGRVAQILSIPYECAEHICSKALAQLYLCEFAQLTDVQKKKVEDNIKSTLTQLAKYHTGEGGFSNWPNHSYADHFTSAYALLFLNKAEEKGYLVDEKMYDSVVRYVQNQAKNWKLSKSDYENHIAAFSVYVLASSNRSNVRELGAMNRMKAEVSQLSENDQYLLASAYAQIGQHAVAKDVLTNQGKAFSYGGGFSSDITKVIAQTLVDDFNALESAEALRTKLASSEWLSTMETAMAFHAMSLYYKKHNSSDHLQFRLLVNQKEFVKVNDKIQSWTSEISQNGAGDEVKVYNNGETKLYATANLEGWANQTSVEAISNGLTVTASYNGCATLQNVEQGGNIRVVVNVNNISGKALSNIAVSHILPAGFEVVSADKSSKVEYQDVRDDRILSYISKMERGESVQIVLTLSATYPGVYYMPSCSAEDMYDKTIFGCTSSSIVTIR
jgi:uncharacterized protein YfaS (alpha-2-macroglobulin family)